MSCQKISIQKLVLNQSCWHRSIAHNCFWSRQCFDSYALLLEFNDPGIGWGSHLYRKFTLEYVCHASGNGMIGFRSIINLKKACSPFGTGIIWWRYMKSSKREQSLFCGAMNYCILQGAVNIVSQLLEPLLYIYYNTSPVFRRFTFRRSSRATNCMQYIPSYLRSGSYWWKRSFLLYYYIFCQPLSLFRKRSWLISNQSTVVHNTRVENKPNFTILGQSISSYISSTYMYAYYMHTLLCIISS